MYNSSDFNESNLFKRFNGWYQGSVKNLNSTTEEYRKLRDTFETILIHANSIIINLNQIRTRGELVIKHFKSIKPRLVLKEKRILFYSPLIVDILGKISAILASISFMQNKILMLISRELHLQLPNSMNTLIKAGGSKYKLDNKYYRVIRRYWTHSGKRIKAYRDVDQHHFVLTSKAYIEFEPKFKFLIMFPDNPEDKKIEKLKYEHNYDAIEFLERSFKELHMFYENFAIEFGYNEENFSLEINLDTIGELRKKEGTVALLIENLKIMRGLYVNYFNSKLEIHPFQLRDDDKNHF